MATAAHELELHCLDVHDGAQGEKLLVLWDGAEPLSQVALPVPESFAKGIKAGDQVTLSIEPPTRTKPAKKAAARRTPKKR